MTNPKIVAVFARQLAGEIVAVTEYGRVYVFSVERRQWSLLGYEIPLDIKKESE